MENYTSVSAKLRNETGTGAVRRMRAKGRLPAAVNDVDGNSLAIDIDKHAFEMLLRHHTGESLLLDVEIEGQRTLKALLKEVQRDSVSSVVLHADLKEVSMTETLRVSVALELSGEAIGVHDEGGVIEHALHEIEVECLPADMVEKIDVDVSGLGIGDTLMVGDLDVPATLTVVTSPDVSVVSVVAPRIEEEEEEEEAEVEGAEPALVGEQEKAEEEENK